MLTFLALYGPDSPFGWLVLLIVTSLPVVVVSAVILVLIIRVALAAFARYRPARPSAEAFIAPTDPAATASYLRDRALDKRDRSRIDSGGADPS